MWAAGWAGLLLFSAALPASDTGASLVLFTGSQYLWLLSPRLDHRCRFRELLWFVQRLLVLVCHSLPGSFVFSQPGIAPWFAFGLCNLAVEVLARRVSRAPEHTGQLLC